MALAAAVLVTFAGLLVDLETDAWGDLWQQITVLGIAVVATAWVAGRAPDAAAAKPVWRAAPSYLAAVPTALASLATNFAYILALLALFAGDVEPPAFEPDSTPTPEPADEPQQERGAAAAPTDDAATPSSRLPEWLASVVVAPLGEELLCRGVVMAALLRLGNRRTALLVSSVLFAFLHGLGGGYVFELPHRFVSGLLFGALRLWSGRLGPAVVAHALHNGACELLLAD
jgi:membrane protease YdiL (CAAX protease family)